MAIEKYIKKHSFLRVGPEWGFTYKTKGEIFVEPGYIWAPYIGSVDPAVEFSPRQVIVSRYVPASATTGVLYSSKTVNNKYYSTITL